MNSLYKKLSRNQHLDYSKFFYLLFFLTLLNGLFNSVLSGLGFNYPFSTFLYNPNNLFADFYLPILSFPGPELEGFNSIFLENYLKNNPYSSSLKDLQLNTLTHFHHMPLMTFIFIIYRWLFTVFHPYYLFLATVIIFLSAYINLIKTHLSQGKKFLIITSLVVSYPFLFAVTRGNIGAFIVGLSLSYVIVLSFQNKNPYLIGFILSLAVNIRPNSAILVLLFFLFYDFKIAFKYAFSAGLLSLLLFAVFLFLTNQIYPNYNLENFLKGLEFIYNDYIIGNAGVAYGSSLHGGLKIIGHLLNMKFLFEFPIVSTILSLSIMSFFFVQFKNKVIDKYFMSFVIVATYVIAFPMFGDYHLLVFIGYFVVLCNYYESNEQLKFILILFFSILIFAPKNYIFVSIVSAQVLLNPILCIFAIFSISIYYRKKSNFSFNLRNVLR